ncbi:MAG: cytochrome c oxidase subunit II [Haloarculaceae archaeon]
MNRKRVGLLGLFGLVLFAGAIQPAAAQSFDSTTTERLIMGLNDNLMWIAVPITVLVEGILLYTVWRFSQADEAKPTRENRRLEITWTVATAVVLLFVGASAYQVLGNPYVSASAQPEQSQANAEHIQVFAQRYSWSFNYPNVSADNVNGSGMTLENVTITGANVTNVTSGGIAVENATITGDGITSGRLVNGTVTDAESNKTGDDVTFEGVTVEDASITAASIEDVDVPSSGTVVMPKGEDVKLNITSRDWLHSFHVPALGLKKDAFPGKSTFIYTKPKETGTYQLYCAEYCGSGHSGMLGKVRIVDQGEYRDWLVKQWKNAQS